MGLDFGRNKLKPTIYILIGVLIAHFFWSVFLLDSAPLFQFSDSNRTLAIENWAIRGQIGDVMAGHFAALAFLAVALSITFQVEANRQMRESIAKQEESIRQQKESIEKQTEANLEQAKNTLQQAEAIELQATSISQQNEALAIQSETLKAQIEELEAARKEYAGQREALEQQKKEMERQSFDNRFFQMLNSFNEIRDTFYYQDKKGNNKDLFHDALKFVLRTVLKDEDILNVVNHPKSKRYFLNQYQILKLIDNFFLEDTVQAKFYTNIIRAQMSQEEQRLLFLHAYLISKIRNDKYKKLIEKYSLLEHTDFSKFNSSIELMVQFINNIVDEYNLSAFGGQKPTVKLIGKKNSEEFSLSRSLM